MIEDLEKISQRGRDVLSQLPEPPEIVTSWIDGIDYPSVLYPPDRAAFDTHGFVIKKSFSSPSECKEMIARMTHLTNTTWHPGSSDMANAVFRTDSEQVKSQGTSDYFLDSSDRIHFFAEASAIDSDTGKLKPDITDKILGLNKAGHGMHIVQGDVFNTYSTSDKIKSLVETLGWKDSVIPQSMYIFKQPLIGGVVTSHQDSTFLHTEDFKSGEPKQSCLGLWLALHDASVENGCLWVRAGSHKEGLRRRFGRRGVLGADESTEEGDEAKMMFVDLTSTQSDDKAKTSVSWEGNLPADSWPPPCSGLFDAGFVPVECKAGDLVVFPGTLDHLSLPNYSTLPRHTFQLHLVEGERRGFKWSESNWLQYPGKTEFLSVKAKKVESEENESEGTAKKKMRVV